MGLVVRLSIVAVVVSAFVGGCSRDRLGAHNRTGPPFEVAFPDVSVLLETTDVDGTRERLANAQLPESRETYDELLALLDGAPSIDTAHLLLLTEAAGAPFFVSDSGTVRVVFDGEVLIDDETRFSDVVDEMLLRGVEKLSDPSRANAGALMGRTQSSEALASLADRFLPEWDDGSPEALAEILEGFDPSHREDDFILEVLLPAGGLQGEREWIALDHLSFDSERSQLILAKLDVADAVPVERLLRYLRSLSFDSGRTEVLDRAAAKLAPVSGDELKTVLALLSFDSGRSDALEDLAPRVRVRDFDQVREVLGLFSFDSGRTEALAALVAEADFSIGPDELADAAAIASFDSSRQEHLELLVPLLTGDVPADELVELLDRFSFDSGRMDVLQLLAHRFEDFSEDDVRRITDRFSFSSAKEQARELLGAL